MKAKLPGFITSREIPAFWDAVIVSVLTVLGAFLRLWNLGAYGLWRDETWAMFVARRMEIGNLREILMVDGHPPIFYALMRWWALPWGANEFGIRLLPALFGIAAIPLLYGLGRAMFNRQVGVLSAGIGALLPMHAFLSRSARMYSLVCLLAILSVWALYLALSRRRTRDWVFWIVASLLLLYTHNWGALFFGLQNLFLGWHWLVRERNWRFSRAWALSAALIGLLYLPFVPILLTQFRAPGVASGPWLKNQLTRTGHMMRIFNELTSMTWPASRPWPYLILMTVGAISLSVKEHKVSATYAFTPAMDLVLVCALLPVIVGVMLMRREAGVLPSYVTIVVFPALCLLLAKGLAKLPMWPSLAGLALIAALFWVRPLGSLWAGPISAMREIAGFVQAEAGPQDVIIIAPDYLATPFNFYYRGDQPQVAFPQPPGKVDLIDWQEWGTRWREAATHVRPTLDYVMAQAQPGAKIWLVAPLDAYPDDPHFGQIRALKAELDARYALLREDTAVRGTAIEGADVVLYDASGKR